MITEIQKRIMASIESSAAFGRAYGLALYHGADMQEVNDRYHLALWFEGAPVDVKQEFLDEFNEQNDDLRICGQCGCFMTEGYLLDQAYACSDECAIALYGGDEKQLREDIGDGQGDFFWTEW